MLRPDGVLRLLLPARGPLTVRDRTRYLKLYIAARTPSSFPATPIDRHADTYLQQAGLTITETHTRRFVYPISSGDDAELFVKSLYLPGVSDVACRVRDTCREAVARYGPWDTPPAHCRYIPRSSGRKAIGHANETVGVRVPRAREH